MEGNRDESERCLRRSETFLKMGDLEKALKFANKAARLYPSEKAEGANLGRWFISAQSLGSTRHRSISEVVSCGLELIAAINSANGSAASEGEWESEASAAASEASGESKSSPGADGRAGERTKHKNMTSEASAPRTYTKEQQEAVQKVLRCKDYYEILSIEKECTDDDIKRAYKKLALKLHPDKNHAPGSTEAFKAISRSFGILSDPKQRQRYDEYGIEEEQTSVRYRRPGRQSNDYSDYDNEDIFADELFRMFFGANFQREPPRHRQPQQRHQRPSRPHHHRHNSTHSEQQSENPYSLLLQISPLVFLVALSLISTLLIGDPPYSLQQSSKFNVIRLTERLSVQYFVKSDFKSNYGDQIASIDRQVEEEYLRNLQQSCYREKAHRENNMWRARMYNNEHLFEQAKNLKTPSCDRLVKISSGR